MPTAAEDWEFDLQGYLLFRDALSPAEVVALNAELDSIPPLENQQWAGRVHRQDYQRPAAGSAADLQDWGVNLQNIIEAGPTFEALIDHPSWLAHVKRYIGAGKLFIDEAFVTSRTQPGAGSPLHSGAHKRNLRTQFRYHDGQFHCGEINILVALDDVGPGDGATTMCVRKPSLRYQCCCCRGDMIALPQRLNITTAAAATAAALRGCAKYLQYPRLA